MRTTLLLISLCLFSITLPAQQLTFDLTTYTPPERWGKIAGDDGATGYAVTNKLKNTYCQVVIYKSMNTMGNAQLDFETDWQDLVVSSYKVTNPPEAGPSTSENGWETKSGVAAFSFSGGQSIAMLVTMSGYGKRLSVVVLTNTEDYQKEIGLFLKSLNPIIPAGYVKAESQPASPANNPQADVVNNVSIIGTWTKVSSDQSASLVNNGVAGYIRRQYIFNKDGTYINYIKTFSFFADILLTKESGTYQLNGNTITVTPQKKVIELWSKRDGADQWGKLLSSQASTMEKIDYQFGIEYLPAIEETNLILRASNSTQRDGHFDRDNEWFYKLPHHDYDFVKLPE